jgi:hypothetical protein
VGLFFARFIDKSRHKGAEAGQGAEP